MPSAVDIETLSETLNKNLEKNRELEGGIEAVLKRVEESYALYQETKKIVQSVEFSVVEVGKNSSTGELTQKPFNWKLLEQA